MDKCGNAETYMVKCELGKVVKMSIFAYGYPHPDKYGYGNSLKPKVRIWV